MDGNCVRAGQESSSLAAAIIFIRWIGSSVTGNTRQFDVLAKKRASTANEEVWKRFMSPETSPRSASEGRRRSARTLIGRGRTGDVHLQGDRTGRGFPGRGIAKAAASMPSERAKWAVAQLSGELRPVSACSARRKCLRKRDSLPPVQAEWPVHSEGCRKWKATDSAFSRAAHRCH